MHGFGLGFRPPHPLSLRLGKADPKPFSNAHTQGGPKNEDNPARDEEADRN